jgi:hypothetical protein
MILITLKLIIQALKNYYTIPSKNLGTKLKNKHAAQVYNHQEISKLQKCILKGA